MTGEKAERRNDESIEDRQSSENAADIDREQSAPQNGDDAPKQPHVRATEASPSRASEHLQNILNGSGIPLLVVDRNLKLCFFTPAVTALFDVTAADLGQPLAAIPRRFADDDLVLDAQTIIATNASLCREVDSDEEGGCFMRRLLPYRGDDDTVEGAIITFVDISDKRRAERAGEALLAYSNSIIDTVRQSLVVLDEELRIISANPMFYRTFFIVPEDAVGKSLLNLGDRCFDVSAIHNFLDRIATDRDVVEDYAIEIEFPPRGRHALLLNARNIPALSPAMKRTLLVIDDITDRKDEAAAAAKKRT
jgi:two-component system, chemotaxis family, CheB/CheR fusion protein